VDPQLLSMIREFLRQNLAASVPAGTPGGPAGETLLPVQQTLLAILNTALLPTRVDVGKILALLSRGGPAPGGGAPGPRGAAEAGAGGGPGGGLLGGIAGAALGPVAAITAAGAAVTAFVEALNPASVLVFGQALRDLLATIGVAAQPLLEALTSITRELAAALLPVMKQLQPILAQVAGTLASVLGTAARALASILSSLVPILHVVANLFDALAPLLEGLAAIVSGLVVALSEVVAVILEAFGLSTKSLMDGLKSAMQTFASVLVQAVAILLKFTESLLGASDRVSRAFIRGAVEALGGGPRESAVGLAAPRAPMVGDISGLLRQVTQAALLAGPAGMPAAESDTAQRKKMIDALLEIQKSTGIDLERKLERLVEKIVKTVFQVTLTSLARPFTRGAGIPGAEEVGTAGADLAATLWAAAIGLRPRFLGGAGPSTPGSR